MATIKTAAIEATRADGRKRVCANNTSVERGAAGELAFYLHGHNILTVLADGDMVVSLCGFDTVTTRARLRELAKALLLPLEVWRIKGTTYVARGAHQPYAPHDAETVVL